MNVMAKNKKISVKGQEIVLYQDNMQDFISLTDIARFKNPAEPKDIVKNWMRSRTTIEFLGLWEQLNNPDFKGVEFDSFLYEAGSNSFTLSPSKWIEATYAKPKTITSQQAGYVYANGAAFGWKTRRPKFRCTTGSSMRKIVISSFKYLPGPVATRTML